MLDPLVTGHFKHLWVAATNLAGTSLPSQMFPWWFHLLQFCVDFLPQMSHLLHQAPSHTWVIWATPFIHSLSIDSLLY